MRNHAIKEAKNFKCYQRLINKQLLQVSGLYGTAFLSYLPKRSTEIYGAQYADAILVYRRGTPIWRPDTKENTWNSLLLLKRLLFVRELVYFHVNTSPNISNVQTAKNPKERPFFKQDSLVTAPS